MLTNLTTDEGRALALLYALPGASAGLAIWTLVDLLGPPDAWEGVLAFAVPLVAGALIAWTLVTAPGERTRSGVFAGGLGVLLGGLCWSAWLSRTDQGVALAFGVLPLLGWIALSFYRSYQEAGRPAHYPALFAMAWNLPVVLAVAAAFTAAAYGVLWLLAAMFGLIGLPVFVEWLSVAPVSSVLVGGLGALGIGVVRRQEAILLTLRGVVIALLRVLAPIFALGTLLFSLALLVQGLDSLWAGWSPVVLIVTTTTAGVVFVNAVVQDADEDAGTGLLGVSARVQSFVLPVLAGLAAWGMGVRITEHGLTPDRILAAIIAGFALLYALAYAVAAAAGWRVLRRANVGLAGLLAVTGAYMLTPAFEAQEWSAASQLARLGRGAVSNDDFDYGALRFDMGEPGIAALRTLAGEGGPSADKAAEALKAEYRYEVAAIDANAPSKADYFATVTVRPAGTPLPDGFEDAGRGRLNDADDLTAQADDLVLVMNSYADDQDALLWVRRKPDAAWVDIELWRRDAEAPRGGEARWRLDWTEDRSFSSAEEALGYMRNARTAPFGPARIEVIVPSIDGVALVPTTERPPFIVPSPPQDAD